MKTKPVSFVLALVLALSFAFSACAQREPGDTTAGDSPTEATVPETAPATEPPSVDPAGPSYPLTPEKREELEKELEKAKIIYGEHKFFPYLQAALRGEIDFSVPKLDLKTASEIARRYKDGEIVISELKKIQPLPDCIAGSGVKILVYWPDASLQEEIEIVDNRFALYHRYDDRTLPPVLTLSVYPASTSDAVGETALKNIDELKALMQERTENSPDTSYPYFEKVLSGEYDFSARRLTLEDVKRILEETDDPAVITERITELQPEPDLDDLNAHFHPYSIPYTGKTTYFLNYNSSTQLYIDRDTKTGEITWIKYAEWDINGCMIHETRLFPKEKTGNGPGTQ